MAAKKEAELKVLLSKREHVLASVNVMIEMTKDISEDRAGVSSFILRVKRLENIKASFYDLTDRINILAVSLNPDEQIDVKPLLDFDELYYQILEVADSVGYISPNEVQSDKIPSPDISNSKFHLRLPQIDLPKFDGFIENWPTFIDIYLPLIHNNENLSDIEKFHYLVSSLSGSALSIAKNIPLIAANYLIVFNALRARFDNKRVLATTYLDKICKLKPMSSPSFDELSKVTSTLSECVNALAAMNVPNLNEFILFYLASRSLDSDTRQKFEEQNCRMTDLPTCNQLLMYLQNHLRVLEVSKPSTLNSMSKQAANQSISRPMQSTSGRPQAHFNRSFVASNSNSSSEQVPVGQNCPCCSLQHRVYRCDKFQSMDVQSRQNLVAYTKLCFNCLRPNHSLNNCFSKTCCFICGERHNTLLHIDDPTSCPSTGQSLNIPANPTNNSNNQTSILACTNNTMQTDTDRPSNTVKLLGTAKIRLRDTNGYTYEARALLDSCSHDCLMTTSCARRIGLPIKQNNVTVTGVGGNIVNNVRGVTSCTVLPRNGETPRFDLDFVVMSKITSNMPTVTLPSAIRQQFKHLFLADPSFDTASNVDILLGVDVFDKLYDGQRFAPGPELPVALNSIYGWVITGRVEGSLKCKPETSSTFLVESNSTLETVLQRFWEVEEPPYKRASHPDDDKCEAIYSKHMYRESDGRYVVPIMAKEDERLGESYHRSLNRFLNLEKRLLREPKLKEEYTTFLKEYEALGHMHPNSDLNNLDRYIIPHHCVIRPNSDTTKLRVVFDASCKTTNNLALNDIVFAGPKLQVDVIDIITKFRLHAIVFTADMCKMYRQILIIPEDRHYQHILWRESSDKPIQEYELNTVTYGVSSSPYLAIRTIRQLANDHGDQSPRAAEALCEETFMDDIITGAPTVDAAIRLRNDITSLLKLGQLELRKWSSNSIDVLEDIPSEHCQLPKTFNDGNVILKILGIKWDPTNDHFSYSVSCPDVPSTKRGMLSVIARIYDPLGWISPSILTAKLLMQELWQLQITWDEYIPDYLIRQWHKFTSQLKDLEKIKLPRYLLPDNTQGVHIVGFCDGSAKGYGCCVYLVACENKKSLVNLLIGKSKVAPLKTLTVNRLELCGAVLLARVLSHMHMLLKDKIQIKSVQAYSDSSTVLSWINTEPCKLMMYVANRVIQIRDTVNINCWRHVSTNDNPADCCSRGISVSELTSHPLWWHGPAWLSLPPSEWPSQDDSLLVSDLTEFKNTKQPTQSLLLTDGEDDFVANFIERFSSFSKMQRIFAWVLRFIRNLKVPRNDRNILSLSINEVNNARIIIIKRVQSLYLKDAINCVQQGIPCIKSIQRLAPFIDSSGLLRVGGRLINSNLSETAKHPILLPKKCVFSNLLVDYFHRTYLHSGPRTLQSLIIREYWILGIRLLIRSRLSKCVTCFKVRPISSAPLMGNLLALRVQVTKCFESVGIDFGGPFVIKESKRRNARTYKAYICLFVCLSVKAIHLEAVTELSTEAFIAALDRFVARRGICKNIITDCGSNFIGAKRYLNEMFELVQVNQGSIINSLTERNISWVFNPPGAPHFGGIFESGIRSTKHHLRRVVGTQVLTLEELFTVLSKIEAMLNSRPLCALSASPSECDALTPGHFLIGRPLVALPEPFSVDQFLSPHNRWQMIQKLTQHFWHIWQRDYLHTLQQRMKWENQSKNICTGDLVIIKENNLPPLQWKLGRVIETFTGKDNVIRVASVQTASGIFKRPVVKLCPLPLP